MSNDKFIHDRAYHGDDFAKFSVPKIALCGVGTIGSNLLDSLVRQNITNLLLIDHDRVEEHNLGNQIWQSANIGQKKVDAAKIHAYNVSGSFVDVFHKQRVTNKNVAKILKGVELIIDGFDNSESRQILKDYAEKTHTPCLHIGLADDYCEVVWNEKYRVPKNVDDPDVCDYPMSRQISMVAVTLGILQIIKWIKGQELENYTFTLGDFKKSVYQ